MSTYEKFEPLNARPDTEVVRLSGEYDMDREVELRSALVSTSTATEVVADLADVTFMDSSALRVLLEVQKVLGLDGRRLVLRNPRPFVRRLFEITGLLGTFGIT